MTRTSLLLTLAAAAALAGCDRDKTIVIGPDGSVVDETPSTSQPVELPPSIVATKTYRCKGNGIIQIDWLSDNKTANLRRDDGQVVQLTASEAGQPLTAEGYSLSGSAEASTITLERPERGTTICKA